MAWNRRLHRDPPLDLAPDRTILLELDPVVALPRATQRDAARGTSGKEDRFEQEALEFHRRVARGYGALAAEEPGRIRVVDAAGSAEEVERRVLQALSGLLPLPEPDTC